MISKELNFSDFSLARIFLDCPADHLFFVNTEDSRSDFTRQKKVPPASRISRSNPHLSRSLTNLQPGTLHSLSNRTASGKSVPSLIRMVPVLIVWSV